MSVESLGNGLVARFEKRFSRETVIQGELRMPMDGFHVTVLFGPSGCGKTTVLRCLAGLERPDTGVISCNEEVWFDSRRSKCAPPQERDVGFLFQDYALFPHLTVAENIAYGLRNRSREERRRSVEFFLKKFQLEGLSDRSPAQISGGQQQRVALARVLVRRPRLLLLDEPLSSLETTLREELRGELRRLLAEFSIPVIVVTHDRTEAMALGDQMVVMKEGRVCQSGFVQQVFSHPVDLEVARIVGVETILSGEILSVQEGLASVVVAGVLLTAVAPDRLASSSVRQVHVCIKAEDVLLSRNPHPDMSVRNQLPAVVKWLTAEGPLVRIGLDCGFELSALVTRPACEELQLKSEERVTIAFKAPSIHLIPRDR